MQREDAIGFVGADIEELLGEEDGPEETTDDEEGDYGAAAPGVAVICLVSESRLRADACDQRTGYRQS